MPPLSMYNFSKVGAIVKHLIIRFLIGTMPTIKPTKTERSHEENQERYVIEHSPFAELVHLSGFLFKILET